MLNRSTKKEFSPHRTSNHAETFSLQADKLTTTSQVSLHSAVLKNSAAPFYTTPSGSPGHPALLWVLPHFNNCRNKL